MKKLLISILCTIPILLYAQSQVTGTVVDSNKDPLIGVSVVVLNSNTGTITNLDGKFSIRATSKDSLVFSYLGYQKITLKATPAVEMQIKMTEDTKILDEVVVIGYGEQNRKDITGSLGEINVEGLNKIPVLTLIWL
jgi:hypothetical protein